MLGRLVLFIIQLAAGWFLAPMIARFVPPVGKLEIFAYAVIFAILVWVIGVVGALVLKDVARPSPATLTFALVGALIGAGLTMVPQVTQAIDGVIRGVPNRAYPLIGAVIGYALKR